MRSAQLRLSAGGARHFVVTASNPLSDLQILSTELVVAN